MPPARWLIWSVDFINFTPAKSVASGSHDGKSAAVVGFWYTEVTLAWHKEINLALTRAAWAVHHVWQAENASRGRTQWLILLEQFGLTKAAKTLQNTL